MEDSYTGVGRLPVVLVTGYLGSGKTTLVNRLLKTAPYARAAVVVNEFGEVSVDHVLLDAPPRRTRIVDAGCVCGYVHEEIATSLLDLLDRRRPGTDSDFDRVLIETSGLADPVPIIQVLLTDPMVARAFRLRSVITVCDGVHGLGQLDAHDESLKQAAVADVLVLTKGDLTDAEAMARVEERLASVNPGALQCRAIRGNVDPHVLARNGFAVAARSAEARAWLADACYAKRVRPASADPTIRSFTLSHGDPVTVPGLVLWMNLLAGFRGTSLLRVKGIVNVEGRPYAIQAVQTVLSEPEPLERWPGDDRRSHLVFITRGLSEALVRRTLATLSFEGGRGRRNLTIRPDTYSRFKHSMEVFREGARATSKAPTYRSH